MRRLSIALALLLIASVDRTHAAPVTPALKLTADNAMPVCATPERLQQFLTDRTSKLDDKFADIAKLYGKHGEALQLRWDYAFFQMLVETNFLTFKRGNGEWGDVRPKQNNFAGLGATGDGEPGEKFADVSSGVLAHLQHIRAYAGDPVEQPLAKRTRESAESIAAWAKKFNRPITFTDLTKMWSPGDKSYAESIEAVAKRFRDKFCSGDQTATLTSQSTDQSTGDEEPKASKAKPSKKTARNRGKSRADDDDDTSDERPASIAAGGEKPPALISASEAPKGSDPPKSSETRKGTETTPDKRAQSPAKSEPAAETKLAAAGSAAAASTAPLVSGGASPPPSFNSAVCKVWTASFGGEKSVLIQARDGEIVMFTALQVHNGREKEEASAYISAYARGGKAIGEFSDTDQAINKAFELCPKT